MANHHFLDLVTENVLQGLRQGLVFLLFGLTLLLLLVSLLKLEVLGDIDKLLAIEFLELSHGVLIDGIDQEENFETLLLQRVEERGFLNSLEGLASDVVHVLLVLRHTSNVVSERGGLLTRFGRAEAEELGKGWTVLRVFVDTKLDVLAECGVELVELLAVLGDLIEELESLLDNVLLDHLHDLVLL